MPRDPRLYMTFPIDFDEHPKVEPLSDAAFRTFVAMNGYSRRQRLDGRIPVAVARKRWRVKAIDELVDSHPERPLLLLDQDAYVLREYAEHQFTTADEAELHARKAAAGAKGGRAKAAAVAGAKQQPQQDLAGSGIGIGIDKSDSGKPPRSSHVGDASASGLEVSDITLQKSKIAGITDLQKTTEALASVVGPLSTRAAVELVEAITARSKGPVLNVDAYIATAVRRSPDEVQFDFERLDLGVVA